MHQGSSTSPAPQGCKCFLGAAALTQTWPGMQSPSTAQLELKPCNYTASEKAGWDSITPSSPQSRNHLCFSALPGGDCSRLPVRNSHTAACSGVLGSAHFIAAYNESWLSAATPPLVSPAGVTVPQQSCYTAVACKSPQLFKKLPGRPQSQI